MTKTFKEWQKEHASLFKAIETIKTRRDFLREEE